MSSKTDASTAGFWYEKDRARQACSDVSLTFIKDSRGQHFVPEI